MNNRIVALNSAINQNSTAILLAIGFHIAVFAMLFSAPKSNLLISNSNQVESSGFNVFYESAQEKSALSESLKAEKDSISAKASSQKSQESGYKDSSSVVFDSPSLQNKQPRYPSLAKRRGQEGRVLVRAFVDENGQAKKIELTASSNYHLLDLAALDAVKSWRFIPARKLGQNIASMVLIPINFKLQ